MIGRRRKGNSGMVKMKTREVNAKHFVGLLTVNGHMKPVMLRPKQRFAGGLKRIGQIAQANGSQMQMLRILRQ